MSPPVLHHSKCQRLHAVYEMCQEGVAWWRSHEGICDLMSSACLRLFGSVRKDGVAGMQRQILKSTKAGEVRVHIYACRRAVN